MPLFCCLLEAASKPEGAALRRDTNDDLSEVRARSHVLVSRLKMRSFRRFTRGESHAGH
jgi:hypothetical protein